MTSPWMPMPGQPPLAALASFVGMWTMMMAAMMLPSLVAMLRRYARALPTTDAAWLTVLVALAVAGYLGVWAALGIAIYPFGVALAQLAMAWPPLARAAPAAVGAVVVAAGVLQFSAWKAHHLAGCRTMPGSGRALPADARAAWRHGVGLGLHCCASSSGATAILLAVGLMDVRVMAAATAAVAVERLAPSGDRLARAIGGASVCIGVLLIARAAVMG